MNQELQKAIKNYEKKNNVKIFTGNSGFLLGILKLKFGKLLNSNNQ